jgi:hypothetical protein
VLPIVRQQLRNLIGVASHLDGLLCEDGKALPADLAAAVLEEASRLAEEIGWLADDVELRLPRRVPSRRPMGPSRADRRTQRKWCNGEGWSERRAQRENGSEATMIDSTNRAVPAPEAVMLRQVLDLLHLRGIFAWRNHTTGIWDPTRRRFRANAGLRGVADVLGVLPGGRFLAVECKGPRGRLTEEQVAFLDNVVKAGGVALVVKDVKELERELDALGV